jgi:hypothetical protein
MPATNTLDDAIARVRELPPEDQERAAEALMTFAELAEQGIYGLSADERVAVEASKAQVRRGELATEAEVEAAYARFRR